MSEDNILKFPPKDAGSFQHLGNAANNVIKGLSIDTEKEGRIARAFNQMDAAAIALQAETSTERVCEICEEMKRRAVHRHNQKYHGK